MVLKFVRYVRSQPKAVRNQYAFGLSATFTLCVALVWVVTGMNLRSSTLPEVSSDTAPTPFSSLWRQIKEQSATAWSAVAKTGAQATSTDISTAVGAGDAVVANPQDLVLTTETIEGVLSKEEPVAPVVVPIRIASSTGGGTVREVQIATTSSLQGTTPGTSTVLRE